MKPIDFYSIQLKSGFYIYKIDLQEKIIYLKNEKYKGTALIDLDEELLLEFAKHKWMVNQKGYLKCIRYNDKGYKSMQFHRLVMLDELKKYDINQQRFIQVDHINRNKLDNRKCNLRLVDNMINQVNTEASDRSITGLIGVVPKRDCSYTVRVVYNGVKIHEVFKDKYTAALKHDYYVNKIAPQNVPYATNIALGRIPQEELDKRGIKTVDDIPPYTPVSLFDRTKNLYFGVTYEKRKNRYRATVKYKGCLINIPRSFKTAFEAAVAREIWLDEHPEVHDIRNVDPSPDDYDDNSDKEFVAGIVITKQERREKYNVY